MSGSKSNTTPRWNEVLDFLKNDNSVAFDDAVKLKPSLVTRRKCSLFSNLDKEAQVALTGAIKKASRVLWKYTITPEFLDYPEDGSIKPEMPQPQMVHHKSASKYPVDAQVVAHYPNDKLILTTVGVCRCKSARDFRLGLTVPVYRDGDTLFIKRGPRNASRY